MGLEGHSHIRGIEKDYEKRIRETWRCRDIVENVRSDTKDNKVFVCFSHTCFCLEGGEKVDVILTA